MLEAISQFIHFFDPETLVQTYGATVGIIILFGIVFAETGLLFGFFFFFDRHLFTAGFIASQPQFNINIFVLCISLFAAAVLGDGTGYMIGKHFGKRLFHKKDSFLFHKEHLEKAEAFYEKHGGKTIILARFMPIVRTFAPVVAGIADMPYAKFLSFNIIGGFIWAVGLTSAGYVLGRVIPDVDKYLLPIIGLIVIISIAPGVKEVLGSKEKRTAIFRSIKSLFARRK